MSAVGAVVVMGPSGSGKTTIGQRLAERMGWRFIEGDAFHPPANVAKMASGIPLDDLDRRPWLESLAAALREAASRGERVVLACSALRGTYRTVLKVNAGVRFVYLKASPELLRQRVSSRQGHFVPAALVSSQVATLEEPTDAIIADAALSPAAIVDLVVSRLD